MIRLYPHLRGTPAPFAAYSLSNLSGNRRRVLQRIQALEIVEKLPELEQSGDEFGGWRIYEDDGRYCVEVGERIGKELCRELFSGWNYSRANKRWQRVTTPNARVAAERKGQEIRNAAARGAK